MEIQIVEVPIRFRLVGHSAIVKDNCYGDVGFRLMNEMWGVVKGSKLETTGINHWVYLADCRMFVGVELKHPEHQPLPDPLVPMEFELPAKLSELTLTWNREQGLGGNGRGTQVAEVWIIRQPRRTADPMVRAEAP